MVIDVSESGVLSFVYQDDLAEIVRQGHETGSAEIERVSEVEPFKQGWCADILGGPFLGPFELRSEAIAAEIEWIEENLLGKD
jgi:hypothetical protein